MALVTAVVHMASAQNGRGNVLRQGESSVDTQSVIVTARTGAFLSCESGDIVVKVNFTQPFRGLMYAHRSRNSPCRIHGTGGYYYELRIPLKGCGTWQESPRVFVNNITIRFHSALELEEDETKTVVCRYPPPLTQPPGSVEIVEPTIVTQTPTPTRVSTARLSEVEILIIICLLLFLSLLTLGIGIAYFCLKRRNIRIIRKTALSSSPPSQITRLSSSNLQPPSLLSSVLGHTVRIPRAVPYSAPAARSALSSPDHHQYEDSSATETTSGEVSETSMSSSSLAEDQVDASRNLLYRKGGPKSILSIPKAILRKAGSKRWGTEPTVHQLQSRSDSTTTTSVKRLEMEDQTVTTMLESENHVDEDMYWTLKDGSSKKLVQQDKIQTSAASGIKEPVPVYAQVDKNKKTAAGQQQRSVKGTEAPARPLGTSAVPGFARRQMVTETPEERKTSEEVTKNTTVTTSVRREVKETRILSPSLDKFRQEISDELDSSRGGRLDSSPDLPTIQENSEESSSPEPTSQGLAVGKAPKSILIRDVSDIYLTTTVETELRELTTKVSRDIVEQHAKATEEPARTPKKIAVSKLPPKTNNWNVVIRQREPYIPTTETDLDASGESNGESTDEPESVAKPHFDVKIRTIPPDTLKPKKPEEMVSIPPLEMPDAVTKLKEALAPKTDEKPTLSSEPSTESKKEITEENKDKPRTVRWLDDTKEPNPEEGSTVSSSDSFQSAASLRERSSSEVLEVAPTLPSQTRAPRRPPPMLERSTSEIPSPEDNVRWVGGVVPVLESLSPEFLANIPVVVQGGFFNRQRPPTPPSKNNDSA
ncbi:ZP domain-containing protein [Nephila pilipes]|uniref:ZP domain-containing protein n=1 Tax=Nephila pilipes TaxID=299642 RepID=A0A8X6M7J4_NEPPI|nr:ZP domain-containing protein [Nephila pilipes]